MVRRVTLAIGYACSHLQHNADWLKRVDWARRQICPKEEIEHVAAAGRIAGNITAQLGKVAA
jgi:hypothetical protein